MIIPRIPHEVINTTTLLFFVGVVIAIIGLFSYEYLKDNVWKRNIGMVSATFAILMATGLVGSIGFNTYQKIQAEDREESFIEQSVDLIRKELATSRQEKDFDEVLDRLYEAEEEVVVRKFNQQTFVDSTIGDIMVNGETTEVSRYLSGLSTDERESVISTSKESLDDFTVLEFAIVRDEIIEESEKLGSSGHEEVVSTSRGKGSMLDITKDNLVSERKRSSWKTLRNILVINLALIMLSAVITAVLYNMARYYILKPLGLIDTRGLEDYEGDSVFVNKEDIEEIELEDIEMQKETLGKDTEETQTITFLEEDEEVTEEFEIEDKEVQDVTVEEVMDEFEDEQEGVKNELVEIEQEELEDEELEELEDEKLEDEELEELEDEKLEDEELEELEDEKLEEEELE